MTCNHEWKRGPWVFRVNDPGRCYECTKCGLKIETFNTPCEKIEGQIENNLLQPVNLKVKL